MAVGRKMIVKTESILVNMNCDSYFGLHSLVNRSEKWQKESTSRVNLFKPWKLGPFPDPQKVVTIKWKSERALLKGEPSHQKICRVIKFNLHDIEPGAWAPPAHCRQLRPN